MNPDEFEHMHAAWCMSKGMELYRDFFEHHTPWFYYLLAPLVRGAEQGEAAVFAALRAGRMVSLAFTAAALGAVVWAGAQCRQRERSGASEASSGSGISDLGFENSGTGLVAGLVAALFLAGMPMFVEKTIEVRPDVPALFFWMSCLGLVMAGTDARSMTKAAPRRGAWARFLAAGLCLGAAIMFTQKMLFALPGVGLALLGWGLLGGPEAQRGQRLRSVAAFCLGTLIPFLLTWAFFACEHAGYAFLENNFLLNARWKAAEPPQPFLWYIVNDSWPIVLLAGGGAGLLINSLVGALRRRPGLHGPSPAPGFDGTQRLASSTQDQSLLTSSPVASHRAQPDWAGVLLLASGASLLLGLLIIPVAMAQYYLPLLPIIALLAARCLIQVSHLFPPRFQSLWLCPVLILLQIGPVSYLLEKRNQTNSGQLAALALVMSHSSPSETVMDGWRGLGVFRPHAWYYYFLHPEVRGMLPRNEVNRFLDDLEAGRVAPKLIVMDNNLRALSDRFVAYVNAHYEDIGQDIWERKSEQRAGLMDRGMNGLMEGGGQEAAQNGVATNRQLDVQPQKGP